MDKGKGRRRGKGKGKGKDSWDYVDPKTDTRKPLKGVKPTLEFQGNDPNKPEVQILSDEAEFHEGWHERPVRSSHPFIRAYLFIHSFIRSSSSTRSFRRSTRCTSVVGAIYIYIYMILLLHRPYHQQEAAGSGRRESQGRPAD